MSITGTGFAIKVPQYCWVTSKARFVSLEREAALSLRNFLPSRVYLNPLLRLLPLRSGRPAANQVNSLDGVAMWSMLLPVVLHPISTQILWIWNCPTTETNVQVILIVCTANEMENRAFPLRPAILSGKNLSLKRTYLKYLQGITRLLTSCPQKQHLWTL